MLQVTFGWSDDHLNRFEIRGREYGVYHDGGSVYRDATATLLRDLGLRRQERFLYKYDFGDSWIHDIQLEAVVALEVKRTYPFCVAGH